MTKNIANATLTSCMQKRQLKGKPVHNWKLASEKKCISIDVNISKLEKFMTTEVFVVNENDLLEFWENDDNVSVITY